MEYDQPTHSLLTIVISLAHQESHRILIETSERITQIASIFCTGNRTANRQYCLTVKLMRLTAMLLVNKIDLY